MISNSEITRGNDSSVEDLQNPDKSLPAVLTGNQEGVDEVSAGEPKELKEDRRFAELVADRQRVMEINNQNIELIRIMIGEKLVNISPEDKQGWLEDMIVHPAHRRQEYKSFYDRLSDQDHWLVMRALAQLLAELITGNKDQAGEMEE